MTVQDDGKRITFQSKPWLIGKIFAVVFTFLAVAFPVMLVISLVRPDPVGKLTCDAKTCHYDEGGKVRDFAVDTIDRAEAQISRGSKNRSTGVRLVLYIHGQKDPVILTEPIYRNRQPVTDAAAGLTKFLADPARTSFQATMPGNETDWAVVVPYSIVMPLIAFIFLRMWVTREVEIDRDARTVRVKTTRPYAKSDHTLPFDDIKDVRTFGVQWRTLSIEDSGGRRHVLLFVPRTEPYGPQLEALATQLKNLVGNIKAA